MLDKPQEKTTPPLVDKQAQKKEPVVVKKYANRRLYNTETSTYVTLDDLAAMVKAERDFVVYDARSGDDLTHAVLTQIIVEQESRSVAGETMLPIPFLRQLIRFYGDSIGKMVPSYLQVSLDTLTREQTRVREQFASAFTPQGAIEVYQEQTRKNLAMFEQAMSMFSPFGPINGHKGGPAEPGAPATAANGQVSTPKTAQSAATSQKAAPVPPLTPGTPAVSSAKPAETDLSDMRAQLATMQAMIDKLAKDRG